MLTITTPVGKQVVCNKFYPKCEVKIGKFTMTANFVVLDMHDSDVILGMDWLTGFHASMDFFNKMIMFKVDEGNALFERIKKTVFTHMISAMKAQSMVKEGCEAYIAFITEDKRSQGVMFFQKISLVYLQFERLTLR